MSLFASSLVDYGSGNVSSVQREEGKGPTEVPGDYIQRHVRQHVLHLLGHFGDAAIVRGQTLHHEAQAHGRGSGTWQSRRAT